MSELYGFKKNLEKVQVRSKSESAAKSHIVPTLIDNNPMACRSGRYDYTTRIIPELANWNVVVLTCKCGNINQNIVYFRGSNTQNYLIDALSSTVTRAGYYVDWANNSIRVRWVDGRQDLIQSFVQILAVYGLVQNVDVVDQDTEDEPSDEGEDIDITGLTEEVQGIRIGADGTIYDTAGEAVREQYNKLAELFDLQDLEEILQTINDTVDTAIQQIESAGGLILDPTLTQSGQAADAKVVGDWIDEIKDLNNISIYESSGYFDATGKIINATETKEVYTNRIPVKSGDVIKITIEYTSRQAMWGVYCAYDVSGNFISRTYFVNEMATSKDITITIPDNTAYIALAYRTYGDAQVAIKYLSSLFDRIRESEKVTANNEFLLNQFVKTSDFNLLFFSNHSYVATSTGSWQSGGNLVTEQPVIAGQTLNVGFEEMDIFGGQPVHISFFDENDGTISTNAIGTISFCDENTAGLDKKGTKTFSIIVPTGAVKAKVQFRIVTNVGSLAPTVGETYTITGAFVYTGTLTANVRNLLKSEPIYDWDKTVKGINHRGYSTDAPENTLPAYKLSKKKGFNYVETDVEWTSDGVAVLLHDATINRTARNTDGSAVSSTLNIYDITYEQALSYDFGVWKSTDYAGTKIPTFEQFIMLCKNLSLHPYIELKTTTGSTQARIEALVDTVKKCGMQGKVTWISFGMTLLSYVKNYDNTARLGLVVDTLSAENITQAQTLKTNDNEVFIDFSSASDELIESCASVNMPVETWLINTSSGIGSLNPYITGVTSDNIVAGEVLYDTNI